MLETMHPVKIFHTSASDVHFDETQPCSIAFKEVTKEVKNAKGVSYPLIYKVSGSVEPGQMMAIMGLSGSGKTTLLQVIIGRITSQVTGKILIQGIPFDKVMRSHISYVWQDDVFFPSANFTVRDQLMFTAYVQMPYTESHDKIKASVQRVMEKMHLTHIADSCVHYISGGEKRRTSIGTELLTDPRVLFIDEGTSGLDSAATFDLLVKLKALAIQNQIPVVMSIHQPSTRAFHQFDTVLMMSEGYCVFRGRPSECTPYLKKFGFYMPQMDQIENYNPADFIIDVLYSQEVDAATGKWPRYAMMTAWLEKEYAESLLMAGPPSAQTGGADVVAFDLAAESSKMEQGQASKKEMEMEANNINNNNGSNSKKVTSKPQAAKILETETSVHEYQSSFYRQVYAIFKRSFKASFIVQFGYVNIMQNIFMAILVGLCWYQIPNREERVSDFSGFVFFVLSYWFFAGMFEGMLEFLPERAPMRRELVSGDYRLSAYFFAKTLAGIPVKIVQPWIFVTIAYFMAAKESSAEIYFSFAAIVVLSTLVGNSIGMFVGSLTLDYNIATSLTTVVALGMLIVGGFYVKNLPNWLDFLGFLSVFRFAYRASIQVTYKYIDTITCSGGYWIYACYWSTTGTITGTQALTFILGENVDSLTTNIYVLFIYFVAFRFFSYLALLWAEYDSLFKVI